MSLGERQQEFNTGRTRVCPGQLLGTLGLGWSTGRLICTSAFVSGSETTGESKDPGTSYKVVIMHIVHIHCTYIYLYLLLRDLHSNQPERGPG